MNKYVPHILCMSIILTLFLAGCGGSPAPVSTKTTLPTNQTPTPTSSPTPVPTAEPLPDDIVVYPGAQLVVAQRITTGTLYFYRSSASLNGVTAYYMDQMPNKGWKEASADLNGSQGNFLVYIKDSRSVMLNIVPDPITPAQTDITITLSDS